MIDLRSIFENAGLRIKEQGKGWLGLNCPWCGDSLYHLGYNAQYGVFHCWRCGKVPFIKTLSELLGIDWNEARRIAMRAYSRIADDGVITNRKINFKLPDSFRPLGFHHRDYLRSRGLDDVEVESKWGLLGSYQGSEYGERIVCPVKFKHRMVSWVARDITGRSPAKVISCPADKEFIPAKSLLYGYDLAIGNTVVVVEGPFDAMKFGPGAVATLGVSFTLNQVELLQGFRNIFILYDSVIKDGVETEKDASRKAHRLGDMLSVNCNVWILDGFSCDPGDMSKRQIERVKKQIQRIKEKIDV